MPLWEEWPLWCPPCPPPPPPWLLPLLLLPPLCPFEDLWLFFLLFIRLFWNHILICLSVRFKFRASSQRFCLETYALKRNSFSNSKVWNFEYGFRFFLTLTWPVQWSKGFPMLGGKKNPAEIEWKLTLLIVTNWFMKLQMILKLFFEGLGEFSLLMNNYECYCKKNKRKAHWYIRW